MTLVDPASGVAPKIAAEARIVINDLGRGAQLPNGLDFATLAQANSNLVYCTLVGFPSGGPTDHPDLADELLATVLGFDLKGGEPVRPEPLPIASFYGAALAATYIGCALLPAIVANGEAQHIEVPLFSAALNVIGRELLTLDPKYEDPSAKPRLPVSQIYECADGRFIQPHGMYERFVRIICKVAGHDEWADAAAEGLHRLPDQAAVAMWRQRFAAVYKTRPAAEWERLINEAGGACTLCRSHAEWLAERHAQAARLVVRDATGEPRAGVGVELVAHADAAPLAATSRSGDVRKLPLAGYRVADFCIVLAGPTCGRVLAELGAEVIKIDDPVRDITPFGWLDVNRGKRSIIIDLKTDGGRCVAEKLVASCNIVIENFRQGKLAALGIDHGELARARPELICASLNCYDHEGPWAAWAGWEHNAQAATGMQVHRQRAGVPQQVPVPVNDFGTGLLGAFGVVLAVLRRETQTIGSLVRASLTRTATFMQQEMYEAGETCATGSGSQCVRCADGWIIVPQGDADEQGQELVRWSRHAGNMTCTVAVEDLRARGMSPAVEHTTRDLLGCHWLFETALLARWTHPNLGPMTQATPHGSTSGFTVTPGFPAPEPGDHTIEILSQLGLDSQTQALVASGAVHLHRSLFTKGDKI